MLSYGPVVFAVLGLVTYLVANLTLDTARSRVVIIITVVFVVVVLVVVVIAIVGVVIVVMLEIIVVVVSLVPVFLLGLLALAIDATCAFRAEEMPSLISCRMAAKVMAGVLDVDITSFERGYGMIHEDGDNDAISGNDDERAISWKQ
ncbi:hypothetical protein Tco_1493622 [Tanacetum coccineum]